MTSRRFVVVFLATVLSVCTLIAGLNLVMNPLGYYPWQVVPPLVYQPRYLKVQIMEGRPSPEALILGSSRTMGLNPDTLQELTGLTAFNAAVDSARAEDYYAMLRFALEGVTWRPSLLVIGIDLEAFHNSTVPSPELSTTRALRRYLPATMLRDTFWDGVQHLLSDQQTRASLRSLLVRARGLPSQTAFNQAGYVPTASKPFDPDRTIDLNEYIRRYDGFTALDEGRLEMFRRVLALARDHRIAVRGFITPNYGPFTEQLRRTHGFDSLHSSLVSFLNELHEVYPEFTFQDFTDVRSYGGDPERFSDAIHIRWETTPLLLRQLLGTKGGA